MKTKTKRSLGDHIGVGKCFKACQRSREIIHRCISLFIDLRTWHCRHKSLALRVSKFANVATIRRIRALLMKSYYLQSSRRRSMDIYISSLSLDLSLVHLISLHPPNKPHLHQKLTLPLPSKQTCPNKHPHKISRSPSRRNTLPSMVRITLRPTTRSSSPTRRKSRSRRS